MELFINYYVYKSYNYWNYCEIIVCIFDFISSNAIKHCDRLTFSVHFSIKRPESAAKKQNKTNKKETYVDFISLGFYCSNLRLLKAFSWFLDWILSPTQDGGARRQTRRETVLAVGQFFCLCQISCGREPPRTGTFCFKILFSKSYSCQYID